MSQPTHVELLEALRSPDRTRAEQAARALRRLSETQPAALEPYRKRLLQQLLRAPKVSHPDMRVQWNLILVLGRLPLHGRDKAVAVDLFFEHLQHPGSLTRTFALQALFDLSATDPALRARIAPHIHQLAEPDALAPAALRARARKLLRLLSIQPRFPSKSAP